MKTVLKITGMHCASCKLLIEDVCKDIPGVTSCEVDLAGNTTTIEHDASVNVSKIKQKICSLGDYQVQEVV